MTAQCAHLVILVLVIAAAARRCNMDIKGFNSLLIRRRPSVRPPACDKALPADHISRKKEERIETCSSTYLEEAGGFFSFSFYLLSYSIVVYLWAHTRTHTQI